MILFLYGSRKCKLIYNNKKQISNCMEPRGGGKKQTIRKHEGLWEVMETFWILTVYVILWFGHFSSKFIIFWIFKWMKFIIKKLSLNKIYFKISALMPRGEAKNLIMQLEFKCYMQSVHWPHGPKQISSRVQQRQENYIEN